MYTPELLPSVTVVVTVAFFHPDPISSQKSGPYPRPPQYGNPHPSPFHGHPVTTTSPVGHALSPLSPPRPRPPPHQSPEGVWYE